MTAKRLSETRADIATKIEQGRVRYVMPDWFVDAVPARGWTGRTLREMRRDGLITVGEGSDAPVSLTETAQEMLRNTQG